MAYFWTFNLFVTFMLINVFLAIIIDAYAEVKNSSQYSSSHSVADDLSMLARDKLLEVKQQIGGGCKNEGPQMTMNQLGRALRDHARRAHVIQGIFHQAEELAEEEGEKDFTFNGTKINRDELVQALAKAEDAAAPAGDPACASASKHAKVHPLGAMNGEVDLAQKQRVAEAILHMFGQSSNHHEVEDEVQLPAILDLLVLQRKQAAEEIASLRAELKQGLARMVNPRLLPHLSEE